MAGKITQVVWTRQARMSLIAILNYRYSEHPTARNILRKDIIRASKKITFAEQYQQDEIFENYRRIIVRDYKLLYKELKGTVYILNVICTKAKN